MRANGDKFTRHRNKNLFGKTIRAKKKFFTEYLNIGKSKLPQQKIAG